MNNTPPRPLPRQSPLYNEKTTLALPDKSVIRRVRLRRTVQASTQVLGSWVGVRRLLHLSLFLTASRMVLPKILVLTPESILYIVRAGLPGQSAAQWTATLDDVEARGRF